MKIRKKEETRPSKSDHGKYLSILKKRQQARKREKKSGAEKSSIFGGEEQKRKRSKIFGEGKFMVTSTNNRVNDTHPSVGH